MYLIIYLFIYFRGFYLFIHILIYSMNTIYFVAFIFITRRRLVIID